MEFKINENIVFSPGELLPRGRAGREDVLDDLYLRIKEQIFNAVQAEALIPAMNMAGIQYSLDKIKDRIHGNSLQVTPELMPEFYHVCEDIKQKLHYDEPVEIYISNNSEVNACCYYSTLNDESHLIIINSALYNLMTLDELKFVVGHEFGHLIAQDRIVSLLVGFIYPEEERMPIAFNRKLHLYDQLAELRADRFGFVACENVEACITSFYKMASGIDLIKMGVSMKALIEDTQRHLKYYLKEDGLSHDDHPVNPIRVQALLQFVNNSQRQLRDLLTILVRTGNTVMDEYLAHFFAAAGLMVANLDGKCTVEEEEAILEKLSMRLIFPVEVLKKVKRMGIEKAFNESANSILDIDPGMADVLLTYVIQIIFADHSITEEEVNFLYGFGEAMKMSKSEISSIFAKQIHQMFTPKLSDIC